MRGTRVSTGRVDSNRRPSGSRRRHEVQVDWAPPQASFEWDDAEGALVASTLGLAVSDEEAEAGHKSVDGVHPEKT